MVSALCQPEVSLCMIVRDEERHLTSCLASVGDLATEIIVVDTGSQDRTPVIARESGATVVHHVWQNDFAAARNAGLTLARSAWILVLDADETLPDASCEALHELVRRPAVAAYSLLQRSRFRPGKSPIDVAMVRLFPNRPEIRFEQAIHEHVNASLARAHVPMYETTIHLEHSGYEDPAVLGAKRERNNRITAAAFRRDPEGDPHLHYHFAASLADHDDWRGAAREFACCAGRCTTDRPGLAAAAHLRAAECFFKLGELEAALLHLPDQPVPTHHPRALVLRAEIEQRKGNPDAAHAWYAAVLSAPKVAVVPPVALEELKLKVLMTLGDYWRARGRKDLGTGVLKLALEVHQSSGRIAPTQIPAAYAAIVGVT